MSLRWAIFATIIGLIFVGGGVHLYVVANEEINAAKQTTATVLSSGTEPARGMDEYVDVTYRYTVDGQTYESDNVYPGGQPSKDNADKIVSQYPPGATVTAHYNPDDPSQAFLIKDRHIMFSLMLVGMGGISLLAVGRDMTT
ncbi:MAG: DUF3592 domain-containing protein [Halosimplex sp.]